MTVAASIAQTMSLGSITFNRATAPVADGMIVHQVSVPAADPGDLTTRTDDDTGVVTVDDSGHAFAVSDRVDLYWAGGCRRGMNVTVVVTTAVTIDAGAGDNLPSQGVSVTLIEPTLLDVSVLGTLVKSILLAAAQLGQFVFVNVSDVEQFQQKVGTGHAYVWEEDDGNVNPITGDQIEGIYLSHGAEAAATMKVGILHDNS